MIFKVKVTRISQRFFRIWVAEICVYVHCNQMGFLTLSFHDVMVLSMVYFTMVMLFLWHGHSQIVKTICMSGQFPENIVIRIELSNLSTAV